MLHLVLWLIAIIVWGIGMWSYKQDHEPNSVLEAVFMTAFELPIKVIWTAFCIIIPLILGYWI